MDLQIAVVGLGYVGLPVAVSFGKKYPVIGFDINYNRITTLTNGIDYTNEVTNEELVSANISFTSDPTALKQANFIIVAVPTPINSSNQPDLRPLIEASKTVGENLSKGTIVVYESTVYPGVTEEECLPILEQYSNLKNGLDFFVGYSPERINPGDKEHTFTKIKKVVSGQDNETLNKIAQVYGSIVEAGIYKASSIKVAEAAKVIENTQRDVNIALMNELALIFDRLEIDTTDVLNAAGTKWNFIKFSPGLVGGHCIGVDPYYLTYKAEAVGYNPEVILAGRRINDSIGKYIATTLVKNLIKQGININNSVVTILGLTFKENVPDLRNSKVFDIIRELEEFGIKTQVTDPYANPDEAKEFYGTDLLDINDIKKSHAVVLAVSHQEYIEEGWPLINSVLEDGHSLVIDIKGVLDEKERPENVVLWRL